MATTVWKGHLTFGLVSIPVKLYRAARPEKVSFRQLHAGTGRRVRQALVAEPTSEPERDPEPVTLSPSRSVAIQRAPEPESLTAPSRNPFLLTPGNAVVQQQIESAPEAPGRQISRSEIVKGYEYSPDHYVTLTREELAAVTPQTAREMEILEFVQLSEVDPIYYETSYYVAADKGGERAYSLLLEALRRSELVGVAQVAMHNREHVVIIRPGRRGIILHTMFYESEIREGDEYRAEVTAVAAKELELALLLIRNLKAPFEPAKYRDSYREKLDALIQAKIRGDETVHAPATRSAAVVDILEALQRSLQTVAPPPPKPPAAERGSLTSSENRGRRRSERK